MPSVRTKLAVGRRVILVALAGCGLFWHRSRQNENVMLPLDAGLGAKNARWVGIRPGPGDVFVINPVYPPQVTGRYVGSGKALDSFAAAIEGPRAPGVDRVCVVNPTFPPRVTGTFEPLGRERAILAPLPEPLPEIEPRRSDGMVRKDSESGAVRPSAKSR